MASLKELTIKYDVDALELGYIQHYDQLLSDVTNDCILLNMLKLNQQFKAL